MILPFLALAAAQAAAPPAHDAQLRTCLAQARSAPDQAIAQAEAWRIAGGGLHARQCLGAAYVQLERWAPAATVFEQAARDAAAARDPRLPDLWVQSGNAWLAAGDGTKAVQALDAALAVPQLPDAQRSAVHLDRARALVALGNGAGARADIDRALALKADDPFAWYLSAALARRENNLAKAQADIGRAVTLAGDNADILLLAGTIAGLGGNMTEAERLYRRVVELAPQSEAGRAAAESLASAGEAPAATPPQASPARPQGQ